MKIITTILMAIGILAIICSLLAFSGFVLYSLTPDIKSQIDIGRVSAEYLKSYNQKVDDFRETILTAAAAKQKSKFTLVLTKEEINSKLVQMMAEDQLPVKELLVSFENDLCWTYFALGENAANAKIGLVTQPEIVKGSIKLNILEFKLGRLPLPKSFAQRAEDIMNIFIKMQNPLSELPLELEAVDIVNNQLLLTVSSIPLK